MTTHEQHDLQDRDAPPVAEEPPIDDESAPDAHRGRDSIGEPLRSPASRSRLSTSMNPHPTQGFSPTATSPICAHGGPAFRPRSSTIPRTAFSRQTTWFPIWSSNSRPDSRSPVAP